MNKKWKDCGGSKTLSNMIFEPVPPLECLNADLPNIIDNGQKFCIQSGLIRKSLKYLSVFVHQCAI